MSTPSEQTDPAPIPPVAPDETLASAGASGPESFTYDSSFWFACLSHAALMTCLGVLFRYADFILYLVGEDGHVEGHLGWIAGVGMIGALAMRGVQGTAIDHYGPRLVWLASLVILMVSLVAHLWVQRVDSSSIYLLRILVMSGMAGAFGAAITFTSLRSPPARMPEMVGVMGASGFFGWVIGPALGDILFAHSPPVREQIVLMFLLAAGAAAVALVCAAIATRRNVRPVPQSRPPFLALIREYHPGAVLVVGIAMGLGVGLPHTFLRPFTEALNIDRIATFFVVYAATAFTVRIATRRFPEIIGIRAMTLLGLGAMSVSMLLYLGVRSEWMLAMPALAGGTAHGLLFPAVVGAGSGVFPSRFRGTGTILMLAMFDVGNMIGQPCVGSIIETAKHLQMPPYDTMFIAVASVMCLVAIWYAFVTRGRSEG
jgi:MFS family permease